jgi:hypothetical protein
MLDIPRRDEESFADWVSGPRRNRRLFAVAKSASKQKSKARNVPKLGRLHAVAEQAGNQAHDRRQKEGPDYGKKRRNEYPMDVADRPSSSTCCNEGS